MKALAKVRAVGGSLVVTIPKLAAESESIKKGDKITIDIKREKKDYFGAFKGIGPFTQKEEMKSHE
jgi:PDZ domain-containing secreted protein